VEAEVEARVAARVAESERALAEQHGDELEQLRHQMAVAEGELKARRAAETRARMELRARRTNEQQARAGEARARSELQEAEYRRQQAEQEAERAARAKQFQEDVGLSPRGGVGADAATDPMSARPTTAAAAAAAAVPPLRLPTVEAAAARAGVAPEPAAAAPVPKAIEAARQRYAHLTPRTGARAAQADSINQMMATAEEAEEGWTPRGGAAAPAAPTAGNGGMMGLGETPRSVAARRFSNVTSQNAELRAELARANAVLAAAGDVANGGAASVLAAAAADSGAQLHARAAEIEAEVRALTADSTAAGERARAALDAGRLEEATRQAEIAEGHAAAARAKRRELEEVQLEQVQLQTADGGGDGVYRTCSGGTVSTGSPPKASDAELCSDVDPAPVLLEPGAVLSQVPPLALAAALASPPVAGAETERKPGLIGRMLKRRPSFEHKQADADRTAGDSPSTARGMTARTEPPGSVRL